MQYVPVSALLPLVFGVTLACAAHADVTRREFFGLAANRVPFGLTAHAPPSPSTTPMSGLPASPTAGEAAQLRNFAPFMLAQTSPWQMCRQAANAAGRTANIPDHLMAAIARVESGRADGVGGVAPWPWSVNAEGVDHVYESKSEAVAAVAAMQARGMRSIDIGCMQVNLLHHPTAFASLDQGFDPAANTAYAARFLNELFAQSGSWQRATAMYHSATPELGNPYQRKVEAILPDEQRRGDPAAGPSPSLLAMAGGSAGAIMLSNNPQRARVLPPIPGRSPRGLDAYRSAPVPITGRISVRVPR